jgi:hypothetical protein
MKGLLASAVLAAAAMGGFARAAEDEAAKIAGSYLLHQSDGYFRILAFDSDGKVSQVSDQQQLYGFTAGQGTWSSGGGGMAAAHIIDFAFDRESGEAAGPSLIVYTLTFGEAVDGRYQTVTGSYAGKDFGAQVDPLDPSAKPVREFGIDFNGRRIPAP